MAEAPAIARHTPNGLQVVHVTVDQGYRPAVIHALAGVPLRVVFHRLDDSECADRVVFSAPRLERRLARDASTTIDIPPQPAGDLRFTCGMGRYAGRVVLTDAPASPSQRLRAEYSSLQPALGIALVGWIVSLPFVALFGVLTLNAGLALVMAGAVLIAWLIGCLWVFGRPVRPSASR
ncbi:MAG: cupredoxin domain-containing protein [Chloroflexota bacterium]